MDIRKVKKLIQLLDESGMSEIEITEGDESVRISRNAKGISESAPADEISESSAPALTSTARPIIESSDNEGYTVTAPMVGTFFSAASPESPPFVQVGDKVNEGDILCIIEAMKMMNQIEADVSGIVKSIRAQNGEPVEYDQVLFVIDQSHPE
jgi:acetyl-CoA carboxylase biotin carboxyl carrier protein